MGEGAVDLGIAGLGPATPFARGGFATVYRAEQLSLRRQVAVKVLEASPDDQVAFSRFERECHAPPTRRRRLPRRRSIGRCDRGGSCGVRDRRRWRSCRRWPLALGALAVGGLLLAGLVALGLGPFAPTAPMAELVFSQALVEPLETDRTYTLAVRNAPADSTYQLLVDDEPEGEPVEGIVGYRAEPGRHWVAVAVNRPDGTVEETDAVDLYVSPGPPQGGYRVNLAAVRISPENWPLALQRFDQLVDDGHEELVLSVGGSGDIWAFYIDGYGPDSDAAWAYCERFELGPEDCFAAEVPVEDE